MFKKILLVIMVFSLMNVFSMRDKSRNNSVYGKKMMKGERMVKGEMMVKDKMKYKMKSKPSNTKNYISNSGKRPRRNRKN